MNMNLQLEFSGVRSKELGFWLLMKKGGESIKISREQAETLVDCIRYEIQKDLERGRNEQTRIQSRRHFPQSI